jgi:hypothetical protein
MARDYDPEKWDEEMNRVMMKYWSRHIPHDEAEAMSLEMDAVRARWLEAAKSGLPLIEVWYEDTQEESQFLGELDARMTLEDARTIRSLRSEEPEHTWRAIAEWAYENRSLTWKVGWLMPGHQHIGTLICITAAAKLGEDACTDPWN